MSLPARLNVRGKPYTLCAALVNVERAGAPSNITILPPKHSVQLAGGEKFITLYVPSEVLPADWETRK